MVGIVEVALGGVGHALGEVMLGFGVAVLLAVGCADIDVAEADLRIHPGLLGERDAALEVGQAVVVATDQQRRADDVLGRRDRDVVVEAAGELDRLAAEPHRHGAVAVEHPEMGLHAVGVGELARRR